MTARRFAPHYETKQIILYNLRDKRAPRARAAHQMPLKSRFDLIRA